jgi:hypothetical protein
MKLIPLDELKVEPLVLVAPAVIAAAEVTKQSKRSKQPVNAAVSTRHSLRTQLITLFALILFGCVIMMMWVIVRVNQNGAQWSSQTETQLHTKVVTNLQSIADAKATYVRVKLFI